MLLSELLSTSIVSVNFTKVNGDNRFMLCTKNEALIPSEHSQFKGSNTKDLSDTHLKVFDLENQGWRTIIIENIISFFVTDDNDKGH